MIFAVSNTTSYIYQNLVKPLFFKLDAESVHLGMVRLGHTMGQLPVLPKVTDLLYAYHHPILAQDIHGIHFENPIGLAAGFDYNADLTQILQPLGFGFQTVGTITAEPYKGNTPPRLGRLPKSKSLLVNKGYKNPGIDAVVKKLGSQSFPCPVGLSVGSTNRSYRDASEQIQNFLISFQNAEKNLEHISYYELNISCPNLSTGEPFTTPKMLSALLSELEKVDVSKPVFLKMPTDISVEQSNLLLKIADKFTIAGAVFGNLTKDRTNPDLDPQELAVAPKGNFSGKPTQKRTNLLLESAYREYSKRYTFIGCGGIFCAKDAYLKVRLGANLLQMITGMIFMGPQVIGQINLGLHQLLEADGYSNLSEAVGVDVLKKKKLAKK